MKHTPIRTCIATGVKKPKGEMVRVVKIQDERYKTKEDTIEKSQGRVSKSEAHYIVKIDPKGKESGRGASIDNNIEAFDLAVKKGAIERALKLDRKLTPAEIETLRQDFLQLLDERAFRKGNQRVVLKVKREVLEKSLG